MLVLLNTIVLNILLSQLLHDVYSLCLTVAVSIVIIDIIKGRTRISSFILGIVMAIIGFHEFLKHLGLFWPILWWLIALGDFRLAIRGFKKKNDDQSQNEKPPAEN